LSNLANRQTDKQTDTGEKHNLLPLAAVLIITTTIITIMGYRVGPSVADSHKKQSKKVTKQFFMITIINI